MPQKIKKTVKSISRSERREILAQIADLLGRGYSKDEIIEMVGLEAKSFEPFLNRIFSALEGDHSTKSPLRLFAEYTLRKNTIVRDLEALKDELRGKNKPPDAKKKWYNAQAFVMACRLQSDILDQQIKTGQELGIIERKPDGLVLINGQDPREMSDIELEDSIRKELMETVAMLEGTPKRGKVLAFGADRKRK